MDPRVKSESDPESGLLDAGSIRLREESLRPEDDDLNCLFLSVIPADLKRESIRIMVNSTILRLNQDTLIGGLFVPHNTDIITVSEVLVPLQ